MMRLLLFVSWLLLLATLLLWVWLLWHHLDPDLLLLPAGVVYLGLSFHRIPRLATVLERCYTFQLTTRSGCCLLIVAVAFHLVSFAQSLGAALAIGPARPNFWGQLIQGCVQGSYWIFAVLVVLMAVFRLPGVDSRLSPCPVEGGADQ